MIDLRTELFAQSHFWAYDCLMNRPKTVIVLSVLFFLYFLYLLFQVVNYVLAFGVFELFGAGIFGLLITAMVGLLCFGLWFLKSWLPKVLYLTTLVVVGRTIFISLFNEDVPFYFSLAIILVLHSVYFFAIFYVHKNKNLFVNR